MNNVKKIRLAVMCISALILCLIAVNSVVSAYLISADKNDAEFTVGSNENQIVEEWDEPAVLTADSSYRKCVAVKNTGTTDAYIRVFAEVEDPDTASRITVDYNESDWEKEGGYWYYRNIVEPGETTDPLFTMITVSDDGGPDITDFNMIVYSESSQCYGSNSYMDAF